MGTFCTPRNLQCSVCPNPNFCNVITHNERNERDGDGRIGYVDGMEADAAREQTMTDQMGSRDETLNPMALSNQLHTSFKMCA